MNDQALESQFRAGTLPREEWTHRAHVRMAWLFRRRYESEDPAGFIAALGDAVGERALLQFYSRERLVSLEARARFLAPDLAPLP